MRKGMEVEVIDDANKSVRQQANGCHRYRLLKGGREVEKMEVHVGHRDHHGVRTDMMPRVYIGCRGEARSPKTEGINGNESGIQFLILFYFALRFPTLHCHISTSAPVCLAFRTLYAPVNKLPIT